MPLMMKKPLKLLGGAGLLATEAQAGEKEDELSILKDIDRRRAAAPSELDIAQEASQRAEIYNAEHDEMAILRDVDRRRAAQPEVSLPQPKGGEPIPEEARQAYREKTGKEAPTHYPSETTPWWINFLKDLGLFSAASTAATAVGGAMSLTGAGAAVGVPLMAAGLYVCLLYTSPSPRD